MRKYPTFLLSLPLITFACYVISVFFLSKSGNVSFDDVILYSPLSPPAGFAQIMGHGVMGISAVLLVFFLPAFPLALCFLKNNRLPLLFLMTAYAIQLSWFILSSTAFKIMSGENLTRTHTLILYGLLYLLGAVWLLFTSAKEGFSAGDALQKEQLRKTVHYVIIFVLVLLLFCFSWEKTFVENFSGDGVEAYEFAQSLVEHPFAYWTLENGHSGFYPNFLLTSYPNCEMILLCGGTENAVRIPFFVHFLMVLLLVYEIFSLSNHSVGNLLFFLLVGTSLYYVVICFHYSTYSFTADLAEPVNTDTLFTFVLLALLYSLISGFGVLAIIFGFYCSITLVSGFYASFLVYGLCSILVSDRRKHFITFFLFLFSYGAYSLLSPFIGGGGKDRVSIQSAMTKHLGSIEWDIVLINLEQIVKTIGLLPILVPLVFLFVLIVKRNFLRDTGKSGVTFCFISLGYLLPLCLSPKMHIHYLVPLQFLFLVSFVWICRTFSLKSRQILYSLHLLNIVLFLLLAFPRHVSLDETGRYLGLVTKIQYSSREKEFDGASLFYLAKDKRGPFFQRSPRKALEMKRFYIGIHTLLYYSRQGSRSNKQNDFLLTDAPLADSTTWKLLRKREDLYFYCRNIRVLRRWSNTYNDMVVPGPLFRNLQFGFPVVKNNNY